ncbi:DUF1631 family protein [Rhodoferax sp.]|uniref:DUF1631 family protein n=1 Tax=Rhodoferax sp. TaxID=50421 RepID=UPI0026048637|nr:DUF1631 family protein [Rhodoferax sp.]MDD2918216.1 DUF1631 family protein [Rhodoferax sp.]
MATFLPAQNKAQLAEHIRQRLVDEAVQSMAALLVTVELHLTTLSRDVASVAAPQLLRETWTLYQNQEKLWLEGTAKAWRAALKPDVPRPSGLPLSTTLELVSTETVENQILASRIALSVMEVAASEVNGLRKRLKSLNPQQELSAQDIVHPEVLALAMVEQWVACGLSLESWQLINSVVQQHINAEWRQIYARCNAELVEQGVMPVIAAEARAQPKPAARSYGQAELAAAPTQGAPDIPSLGAPGWPVLTGDSAPQGDAREMGVLDRVGRLMTSLVPVQNFAAAFRSSPSQRLMTALAHRPLPAEAWGGDSAGQVLPEVLVQQVAQMAGDLQQKSVELKKLAQNDNEKAIIELITLMFQSILQEDRIPPGIRVWFARLQMPVLSLALTDPNFFNRQDHPARLLIDHMGSCVLGFDASAVNSDDLAAEIKRVVQVIEQYPEVGERVYQRVYEEFKEFLKSFLTQKTAIQKVVGVAQQVEQKETLAIQCTIELRNQIKEMPVRDGIRDFLYKVWSEVIAVASMRQGGQHETTLALKKTATDLIWAASAKPDRADRARVIADLPVLLQSLRYGMSLLALSGAVQDGHVKVISDILADAFMSKTPAIDLEEIQAMAERLAHLEDYFSNDGAEELPLDAQSIEDLLDIDTSDLEVVTSGGTEANPVMMAWAQNLSLGAWFALDFLGQSFQIQYVWRSPLGHLHLFSSFVGRSYLIQTTRLAAYLQDGMLRPQEEVSLTVRATCDAMAKLEANPALLLA